MKMQKTAVALGTVVLTTGLVVGAVAPANAVPAADAPTTASASVPLSGSGVTSVQELERRGDVVVVRGETVPGATVIVTGDHGVLGEAGADGAFAIETRGVFPTPTFTVTARLGKLAPDTATYKVVDGEPVVVADGEHVGWEQPAITRVEKDGYRLFVEGTGVPGALALVRITPNAWFTDVVREDGTFRLNAGTLYSGSTTLEVKQGNRGVYSESVFTTVS